MYDALRYISKYYLLMVQLRVGCGVRIVIEISFRIHLLTGSFRKFVSIKIECIIVHYRAPPIELGSLERRESESFRRVTFY